MQAVSRQNSECFKLGQLSPPLIEFHDISTNFPAVYRGICEAKIVETVWKWPSILCSPTTTKYRGYRDRRFANFLPRKFSSTSVYVSCSRPRKKDRFWIVRVAICTSVLELLLPFVDMDRYFLIKKFHRENGTGILVTSFTHEEKERLLSVSRQHTLPQNSSSIANPFRNLENLSFIYIRYNIKKIHLFKIPPTYYYHKSTRNTGTRTVSTPIFSKLDENGREDRLDEEP